MLKGIAASAGIGIGKAVFIEDKEVLFNKFDTSSHKSPKDSASELRRYLHAAEVLITHTEKKAEKLLKEAGEAQADILRCHIMIIKDNHMNDEIKTLIEGKMQAEAAVEKAYDNYIALFSASENELTRQRAADLKDVKISILRILLSVQETDLSEILPDSILAVVELTPSMAAGMSAERIKGIVTKTGGFTSHAAILARALGIPAVFGVTDGFESLKNADRLIIDGTEGIVITEPSKEQVKEYEEKQQEEKKRRKELQLFVEKPAVTADGIPIHVAVNIGNPDEAMKAAEYNADGIGLFRTEFIYLEGNRLPTEEEQFSAYRQAALLMKEKPMIIRTLDIGGDKELSYLGLKKEENPYLGCRGIRYCLGREDIYRTQLRAILRASAFGNVKIMLPMVTCVEEVERVKELLEELKKELEKDKVPFQKSIEVGVMLETAAAAVIADLLAAEADFFSIGTNDLIQYIMAADRGNERVSYLYSPYHPAMLREMKRVAACAKEAEISVGMCGEAAADPLLTPLLISFGISDFSVSPVSVLAVKRLISLWSKEEADRITNKALEFKKETEVRKFLTENQRR